MRAATKWTAVAALTILCACGGAAAPSGGPGTSTVSTLPSGPSSPFTAPAVLRTLATPSRPAPPKPAVDGSALKAPWSLLDVTLKPAPIKSRPGYPGSAIYGTYCHAIRPTCLASNDQTPDVVLAVATDVANPTEPVDPNSPILPTFRNMLVWAVIVDAGCPPPLGPAMPSGRTEVPRPSLPCEGVTLFDAASGRYLMALFEG
jgi:hypothetical protein